MAQQKSRRGYYTLHTESELLDRLRDPTAFVIYHKMRQKMDKETKVYTANGWEELIGSAMLPSSLSPVAKKSRARRAVEELITAGLLVKNSKNEYKLSFGCVLAPDYIKNERDTDSTRNSTRKTTHQDDVKNVINQAFRENMDVEGDIKNDTVGDTGSTCAALSPHTPLSKNSNKKYVLYSLNAYARDDENLTNLDVDDDSVVTKQGLWDFMKSHGFSQNGILHQRSMAAMKEWVDSGVVWRTLKESVMYADNWYKQKHKERPQYVHAYKSFVMERHAAEQEAKKNPVSAPTLTGQNTKQTTRGKYVTASSKYDQLVKDPAQTQEQSESIRRFTEKLLQAKQAADATV